MAVVFLSSGTMTGVKPLVERLRDETGVRCVSREDLVDVVNRHGKLARRVVEKIGEATRAYDLFCDLRRPYIIFMRAALLEWAAQGPLLYHGFSGHLLLPPIRHFATVRIHAPMEMRVRASRDRLPGGTLEAEKWIRRDDEERVRWARFMYGKDVRDPTLHDLCIGLGRIGLDTASRLVRGLMEDPDLQPTEASEREVADLLRAARIDAALAADPRTESIEAGAVVRGAKATLIGPYLDASRREMVREIAGSVEGLEEVTYQYGFAPVLGGQT